MVVTPQQQLVTRVMAVTQEVQGEGFIPQNGIRIKHATESPIRMGRLLEVKSVLEVSVVAVEVVEMVVAAAAVTLEAPGTTMMILLEGRGHTMQAQIKSTIDSWVTAMGR